MQFVNVNSLTNITNEQYVIYKTESLLESVTFKVQKMFQMEMFSGQLINC